MTDNKNTPLRGFQKAWDLIPAGEISKVKQQILSDTGWKDSTFYKKRTGTNPLNKMEVYFLTRIFEAQGISIDGTYLKQMAI